MIDHTKITPDTLRELSDHAKQIRRNADRLIMMVHEARFRDYVFTKVNADFLEALIAQLDLSLRKIRYQIPQVSHRDDPTGSIERRLAPRRERDRRH